MKKKTKGRPYDLILWSIVFVIMVLIITLIILIFRGNRSTGSGVVVDDGNQTTGRVITGDNTGVVVTDRKSGVVIDGNNSGFVIDGKVVERYSSGVVIHGKVSGGVYSYEGDGSMTVNSNNDVVMNDSGSFILTTSTTRIKAMGAFEIVVVSARTPYAIVDPGHRDMVSVSNTSPDTVMIRWKGDVRRDTARVEIGLQRISAIDVDGAVDVVMRNVVCQRDGLRVKTSGVSTVKSGGMLRGLDATRSTVSINASGSSMIMLRGDPARNARIKTTGSARVDTRDLYMATVRIDASGTTAIRVSVSDVVSGVATDASTVNVQGSADIRINTSGAARVKRNNR